MSDLITLVGTYKKTLYKDFKTGYTMFILRTKDSSNKYYYDVCCDGYIPSYTQGMPLIIQCRKKNSDRYTVHSVKEQVSDVQSAIQFLSGDMFKGIGEETAKHIVDKFGTNIFVLAEEDDFIEKLSGIKGVSTTKAEDIAKTIRSTVEQRKLYEYLSKYGYNYDIARTIYEQYGNFGLNQLKMHPYAIGMKCGLSFSVCDAIAKKENHSYCNTERIEHIVYQTMLYASQKGHTFLFLDELYKMSQIILRESSFSEQINLSMITMCMLDMKKIMIEYCEDGKIRVFLRVYYEAEKTVSDNIHRLLNNPKPIPNKLYISEIEKSFGITYDNKQKEAFHVLDKTGISIINGGPGTGKTTTIKGFVRNFQLNNPDSTIALCAPTGRAAQRMEEAIGMGLPAYTIHKLLGIQLYGEQKRDASNPLEYDLIIVDEMSMVDIKLFSLLLKAVNSHAILLLVGDTEQLPSVDAGNVLKDLINANIPTYSLSKIFRQNEQNSIVYNANKIQQGKTSYRVDDNYKVYRCKDQFDMRNKLLSIYQYYKNENSSNIEILTPMRKTSMGSFNLNNLLQSQMSQKIMRTKKNVFVIGDCIDISHNENQITGYIIGFDNNDILLNAGGKAYRVKENMFRYISINSRSKSFFVYNNLVFMEKDKVIFTENNYDVGYMNGDIGYIEYILHDGLVVNVDNETFEIKGIHLKDVQLAYAITIHKSQGSEYPIGITVLPKCNMLQRKLLFTAVTRAKDKEIILSEGDAYERAILNNREENRNTYLLHRIKKVKGNLIK